MAANPAKPKQSSRWGSLLSGAVAGLESRLDNILAEEGAVAAQNAAKASGVRVPSPAQNNNVSRTRSTSRTKPVQPQSVPQPSSQPKSSTPSQAARTAASPPHTESSSSIAPPESQLETTANVPPPLDANDPPTFNAARLPAIGNDESPPTLDETFMPAMRCFVESPAKFEQASQPATDSKSNGTVEPPVAPVPPAKTLDELTTELEAERSAHEQVELRRQEETHEYLERIDALQAKLQYLSRETAAAARQAVADAGKDLLQKRIAERDERIALLLEEGAKLSKSEVTQASTLRTLRAKGNEDANVMAELRKKLVKAESVLGEKTAESARHETDKNEILVRVSRLSRYEREVPGLKQQMTDKDERIRQLEIDLREAGDRADEDEKSRMAESLEQHERITQSLRDDLANAKIEQGIRDERAKTEARKSREQLQKEMDRNKGAELGLRNEITTLESRMEVMREKSEEASSGSKGDAQAKLMRQIEILQSQYAVASENWQGIEASLQSRVTALERERDESSKHENDARRKAREVGTASRRLQDQLDDSTQRCRVFEHDMAEQRANADRLERRATDFEKALQEAKATFEREKTSWNTTLASRIEEEKMKWQRQTTPLNNHPEPSLFSASPHTSTQRRTSNLDLSGLSARRNVSNNTTKNNFELNLAGLRGANGNYPHHNPHGGSRRTASGVYPPTPTGQSHPYRSTSDLLSPTSAEDSGHSTPFLSNAPMVLEPNSHSRSQSRVIDDDEDDGINDATTSRSSPRDHRTINDMFSASTTAAGPSVQLVSRMSASVRRLETEKAASRDELARLSSQRDDARREVVALMTEVEEARELGARVENLEKQLGDVQGRYAGALEMAGEKSEKCEELEADVVDLKGILRELVERSAGGANAAG